MGTQKTTLITSFSSQRIAQPTEGGLLVMAPRDSGATVAANVINPYRDPADVIADHGANSGLAFSAPFARRNINRYFMGSFADAAIVSAGSRTFGASPGPGVSTFTLPSSETGIYVLLTCPIDGTNVDRIHYTVLDPTTISPMDNSGNGEVWFNPITRMGKCSRASSGAGAGIVPTYKRADLNPLFDQALMKPIKHFTFGGNWRRIPQYAAVWNLLSAFADANDFMVSDATADSPDFTDANFQALIATDPSNCVRHIAAQQVYPDTEDLGVAYAALVAATPPDHTLKDQPAPKGIVFQTTLPYTRRQYGDDVDPANGTAHKVGVNVIVPSDDGSSFVISSDRNAVLYSDSAELLFAGQRATSNAANDLVRFEVNRKLQDPTVSAKFDDAGLAAVKGAFQVGLLRAAQKGYIVPGSAVLDFPTRSDLDPNDIKKRALEGTSMEYEIENPIQTASATVVVTQ
jgi:hypothetical protein